VEARAEVFSRRFESSGTTQFAAAARLAEDRTLFLVFTLGSASPHVRMSARSRGRSATEKGLEALFEKFRSEGKDLVRMSAAGGRPA
jgi:hypothetical protein